MNVHAETAAVVRAAIAVLFFAACAYAQSDTNSTGVDECAVAAIASGFGANGPHNVRHDSVSSPLWDRQNVHLFYPAESGKTWPLIILCHTYGAIDYVSYEPFIRHLVSRGNAVLYPPVRRLTFTRKQLFKYEMAYEGIDTAIQLFSHIVDTTKIGIVGHGYGAGMAPSLGMRLFGKRGWGRDGAFMMLMSPWYIYGIDLRGLKSFPKHVKLVVQVYEHDRTNDPKIAADLFDNIGIPSTEKDFMVIHSDRRNGCRLWADDEVPLGNKALAGENNALDYYGVWKTVDALAAYAFYNERGAKNVCLGDGSPDQVYMGRWPDGTAVKSALVTDVPQTFVGSGVYINRWKSVRNPRVDARLFRKARKLFLTHWREKVRAASRTAAGKVKAKRFLSETDIDYLANPILEGYGADGSYSWSADSFANTLDPKVTAYVFMPQATPAPPPVLFLIPGYSGADPYLFEPFLSHILSRGIAVFFSPYPILPTVAEPRDVYGKLEIVRAGFRQAMERYRGKIDTTKVGFYGQSFGGGLAPVVAFQTIQGAGWGNERAFMFLTAPWYCYDMNDERLKNFPPHVKLLVQVYEDDYINDHEMAVDLFTHIGITATNKDFLLVHTDSYEGETCVADHFVPYGAGNINGAVNLLDYFAIFRMFDALADCAFNGSDSGCAVALGNGIAEQRYMGEWAAGRPYTPLDITDEPVARHTQLQYLWAWENKNNPRWSRSKFTSGR